MVQKKRTYKKRTYKKRSYKPRRYKRVYRRRYYKRSALKKPEIHIVEDAVNEFPFNNSTFGLGKFNNLSKITGSGVSDLDEIQYKLMGKNIEGSKVRLKYLYIKGYIKVSGTNEDDFNCKLMVFRWKRNTLNNTLSWVDLLNNTTYGNPNLSDPSTWSETQRLQLLYMQDWKNDIKINFYKRVKNLYRKYDDANNIIPFKIRIPLYDCVLTCDNTKSSSTYTPNPDASTNGLYFTFLSNQFNETNTISYKWKLYYTDY